MSTEVKLVNYSNVFLTLKKTEDSVCDLGIPEHCLVYVCSGEIEFFEGEQRILVREGECAFVRKDNRLKMHKRSSRKTNIYQSVVLKFTRKFLLDFYRGLDKEGVAADAKRVKSSVKRIATRPDIVSLFESILPYFNTDSQPSEQWLNLKMMEGLYVLLNTDKNIYASLFDFTDPWKIDLMGFMNENYMYDLSMEELASYTGRSLTSFKRDFKKVSELTPQKWIIRKRLEVAYDMITHEGRKVTEAMMDVGFKNLSHFSRAYKATYGHAPSMSH